MKLSGIVHYMIPYCTFYLKFLFEWFWGFPEQNKDFAIQNMGELGYHFVSIVHHISSFDIFIWIFVLINIVIHRGIPRLYIVDWQQMSSIHLIQNYRNCRILTLWKKYWNLYRLCLCITILNLYLTPSIFFKIQIIGKLRKRNIKVKKK